jgi:hypothetical protein
VGCKAEVRCDDEDVVVEEAGMGCDGVDMKWYLGIAGLTLVV